jgi:thiamine-monophosphate kinase
MKVSELGEFGLIDLLAGMVEKAGSKEASRQLILGIGDDAAAWHGDASIQLATTDSLVQDVHFKLDVTSWEELGWRAMAANLSDIAAMGGLPRYALVSLSLPGSTDVEDVASFYKGMIALANQSGVIITGGDISSAPLLVINITVLGSTGSKDSKMLTRSAARPGDKIAVTGYLGASAAGLEVLRDNLNLESGAAENLKSAFLKPTPRVAEGRLLVEKGVRAAIDISDGLIADLRHICERSKVGARLETGSVPVHPAVMANFGERALDMALSGGEDYELLFTAADEVIDSVKKATSCPITVVGEVTANHTGRVIVVDEKGNPVELSSAGWEHFS